MHTQRALGPAETHDEDTASNDSVSASLGDPGDGFRWVVKSIAFSASAAPATAVEVQVLDASTVIRRYHVPAAAFSPVEIGFGAGLTCGEDNIASVTMEAGGSGVETSVSISGIKIKAP